MVDWRQLLTVLQLLTTPNSLTLQPKSDGLQPNRNGLLPSSDGLLLLVSLTCPAQAALKRARPHSVSVHGPSSVARFVFSSSGVALVMASHQNSFLFKGNPLPYIIKVSKEMAGRNRYNHDTI